MSYKYGSDGSIAGTFETFLVILFTLVTLLVPCLMISYIASRFYKVERPSFKRRLGEMYAGLNTKRGKVVLLIPTFFLVRRTILAYLIVYFSNSATSQLLVYLLLIHVKNGLNHSFDVY